MTDTLEQRIYEALDDIAVDDGVVLDYEKQNIAGDILAAFAIEQGSQTKIIKDLTEQRVELISLLNNISYHADILDGVTSSPEFSSEELEMVQKNLITAVNEANNQLKNKDK